MERKQKSKNKQNFEEILRLRDQGFAKEIGLKMTCLREGYASGELEIRPFHINPIGSVHGGVLFTMADTIGGAASVSHGRWCTTVSGTINYLNPALGCRKLTGEAREIKAGKRMSVYEVKITNEQGKIICVTTMTYFYIDVQVRDPQKMCAKNSPEST